MRARAQLIEQVVDGARNEAELFESVLAIHQVLYTFNEPGQELVFNLS